MKIKKMAGALALTAALAMGTMPAFAASADMNVPGATSDTGSTTVKGKVDAVDTTLRAVVPLEVAVTFGAEGASEIVGPTGDAYKITNIGTGDLYIEEAELTDVNDFFSMAGLYESEGSWYYNDVANNTDAVIDSGHWLMLTYKTAGNLTYLTPDHPLSDALGKVGKNNNDTDYVDGATTFAGDKVTANGGTLNIELGGQAYFVSKIANGEFTDTLCKIKYTISKDNPTA